MGIRFPETIRIRGTRKWLAACLLLSLVAALETETTALGAEAPADTIRGTRPLEPEEAEGFAGPPVEYTDENGMVYKLEDWNLEQLPGSLVSQEISRQVVYRDVEAAQSLPKTIEVREPRIVRQGGAGQAGGAQDALSQDAPIQGAPAQNPSAQNPSAQDAPAPESTVYSTGTLTASETQILGETWSDDFLVPMTFHSYGAQVYELGSISMSAQDGFPPPEAYQREVLQILGLPETDYEITALSWNGEPYAGPDGELCREALATGRKRLVDYQVTYDGRVSWQLPDTWQLETVYRLRPSVVETAWETEEETLPAAKEPVLDEPQESGLWYWVRSGFVITVAAGLVGITTGVLILLIMWLKKERNDRLRVETAGKNMIE